MSSYDPHAEAEAYFAAGEEIQNLRIEIEQLRAQLDEARAQVFEMTNKAGYYARRADRLERAFRSLSPDQEQEKPSCAIPGQEQER